MVNFSSLVTRFCFIHCVPCTLKSAFAMTLSKGQISIEEDPWKVSMFVSAVMELFLSVLLLLAAGIAFFTSRIVKFFDLEPPCTYIGCSHHLHVHNEGNPESHTRGLKDHASMGTCMDAYNARLGCGKEHQCSSSESLPFERHNPSKLLRSQGMSHAHSNGKSNEGCPALLSARSSTESIGVFGAEDHHSIVQVSSDSETKAKCQATGMKDADNQCACSDSLFHKRRGRSKRPRRRDFAHSHFNGKLSRTSTLLSVRSNPESTGGVNTIDHGELYAKEGKREETNMNAEDCFIHNTASVQHNEPIKGETMVEDASNVISMVDVTDTGVRPALPCPGPCSESTGEFNAENCSEPFQVFANSNSKGGSNAENHSEPSQVSANYEHAKECEETDIRNKDVSHHDSMLSHQNVVFKGRRLVEDANTAHVSKDEQNYTEESSLDYLKRINVCNAEHSNVGLLPGDNNQYIFQFGSIVARALIKNGTIDNTDLDRDRMCNRGFVNIARTERGRSPEMASNELSTDTKNVFGTAIAARNSLYELTPRNEIIMCTTESALFEDTSTSAEGQAPSTAPFEVDAGEEEADVEDEQEEGLDGLKLALQAERSMLAALEAELENERNAAAVATSEAMAMISRLQEEKSTMQMEVAHLQRMSEERADYDEQAMAVLKEILVKRETENMALEKEVELYRERFSVGSVGDPNGVWLKEARSLARQSSCRPLLLIGQDRELHSPLGAARNRGVPWTPPDAPNGEFKELDTVPDSQNSNKRSLSDQLDDISHTEAGMYGSHDICQLAKKMGKCSSFTEDEILSARESPWVIAKDLQELPGKDHLKSGKHLSTQADGCQPLASSSGKKRATTESCGAQSNMCGIRSDGGELEGGCVGFVPIHDVYEVHTAVNRSPPRVEESDLPEVFHGPSTAHKELQLRMSRHITEFPPRFVPTTKLIAAEDLPSTPTSMVQTADWDIEKSFYGEDLCERHDLRSLSFVSRDERRAELEEMKQLAVRLKALEEDRDLLRETVESLKHKDAELSMLQEISKHLHELRMVSFVGVPERAFSEGTSITSPSRTHPLKKRRYCSGLGQSQTLLQHQKNV